MSWEGNGTTGAVRQRAPPATASQRAAGWAWRWLQSAVQTAVSDLADHSRPSASLYQPGATFSKLLRKLFRKAPTLT